MTAIKRDSRERGFSLVEMLVALAVTGFAALLLATAVGRIEGVVHKGRTSSQALATVSAAQLGLRERLERALPEPDPQNPSSAVDFRGQSAVMDWVGTPIDAAAPDALWRYRLARTADGRIALYHRSSLSTLGDERGPSLIGWSATPLLDGTAALELSYFGTISGPGSPRAWQQSWAARRALPLLVRVLVRFPEGDRRRWAELVVRPRAVLPEDCPPQGGSEPCGDPA